mgnify:CR=1 FL=1
MHLLVIEDERALCETIVRSLRRLAYSVDYCYDGEKALALLGVERYDLVLLDLNLPKKDGMTVLRTLRQTDRETRVLILSARSEVEDKVQGLDAGANDYLTKPFGVMELIARVKAMLRRTMEEDKFLSLGDIFLDDEKHMVYVKDEPCTLTFKEYELLKLLLHNAGIVVTREIILERVWGIDFEGESRTLDMHIRTLRQKLGDAGTMIRTVRNVGYMIE